MRKYLFILLFFLAGQAMARIFPHDAYFAKTNEVGANSVRFGFSAYYTAPGLRILSEKNTLMFLHQLPTEVFVAYRLDGRSQLIQIWVLTQAEIAARKLDDSTSSVTFD